MFNLKFFQSFFTLLFKNKNILFFTFLAILGVAFSIAVVLGNLGLMQGYDYYFKQGLQQSSADLELSHIDGFYAWDEELERGVSLFTEQIKAQTSLVQSDGFLLADDQSRGVLVRGVDLKTYAQTTGLSFDLALDQVVIGKALASELNLNRGDTIVLAFARGGHLDGSLPLLKSFQVAEIISHGLYQKDARLIYVSKSQLLNLVGVASSSAKMNLTLLRLNDDLRGDLEQTEQTKDRLIETLPYGFQVKTFWNDFSTLIEAVEVEKFSISLILQVIVIISLFNLIALMIYIFEKKSQEFFLLRAMGLAYQHIRNFWLQWASFFWLATCLLSWLFVLIFDEILKIISSHYLPGQIYNLSQLSLVLTLENYFLVYFISLIWILLAIALGLRLLKKKAISQGLRQEFR